MDFFVKNFGLYTEAVFLLTKTEGIDYYQYLERIKKNELARRVKIADMTHNSDVTRLKNPTERQLQNIEKYKEGIRFLSK